MVTKNYRDPPPAESEPEDTATPKAAPTKQELGVMKRGEHPDYDAWNDYREGRD